MLRFKQHLKYTTLKRNHICTVAKLRQGNYFMTAYCCCLVCVKLFNVTVRINKQASGLKHGLLSHLNQDWKCFPGKHGRQPTQRGQALSKHAQTCKHRPSNGTCVAFGFRRQRNAEDKPNNLLSLIKAVLSQEEGWVEGDGWRTGRKLEGRTGQLVVLPGLVNSWIVCT